MQLQSSNPILSPGTDLDRHFGLGPSDQAAQAAAAGRASLTGIVNKTGILALVCLAMGILGYSLLPKNPSIIWISAIAALVICLGMGFVVRGNPKLAAPFGWLYAGVEGIFLGALTAALDGALASQLGPAMVQKLGGSLALPAFVITAGCFGSMLFAYRAGLIRPTQRFKSIMAVAVGGIMIAYLAHFALSLLGFGGVPFLSLSSASGSGSAPLIGLGISLVILVVASLTLILDFEQAEQLVASGAPKQAEWFVAFGLIVSLAWIYLEAVKLVYRLALMFGSRD